MPFDGGIGLHDATWRDEFGGEIYKTDGSHGCVNLPKETAKIIYENIDKTMPIIVW
jgi:lipoprotein-anchoring transpeptidase ErfK/SrfK